MTRDEAYKVLLDHAPFEAGRFFGNASGLSIGAGVICQNVRFPTYDRDRHVFVTRRGPALIVSHECDVSQDNDRPFNDDVLVCPLIPLEESLQELEATKGTELIGFLSQIALRKVQRIQFIPSLHDALDYGAFILANRLAATKYSTFELPEVKIVGALSAFGLAEVDRFFQGALFRPKAETLSFAY